MHIKQLELTNHDCFCRQEGLSEGMVIFTQYYPEFSASYVYQLLQWLAVVMGQQWCIFHWITHSYSRGQSVKISNCKTDKNNFEEVKQKVFASFYCVLFSTVENFSNLIPVSIHLTGKDSSSVNHNTTGCLCMLNEHLSEK